jgi:flagellar motor switch protein FliN
MSDNDEQEGQSNGAMTEDEKLAEEWGAAMEESGDSENSVDDEWAAAMAEAESVEGEADNVQTAPLESFENAGGQGGGLGVNPDLDVILDIPVMISMEVGSTQIPIRNLLQLNQGSVVELDRLAGEPLDVLVNGTLIAHGEVVMVNEKFGIRLTDVVSPSERIKRLN